MSFSPTIVPTQITSELRKQFLKLTEDGNAFFVDVVSRTGALRNKCAFNAANEVDAVGGNIIYGWSVFVWELVYVQYIGHAIVEVDGEVYCVTPTKHGENRVLFLPDKSLSFNFEEENFRMPSKTLPISKHKLVEKLIEVERQLYELKSKYPASSDKIMIVGTDAIEYKQLEEKRKKLSRHTIYLHHPLKASCPCGLGKQFLKCCRPRMKNEFSKKNNRVRTEN